jgi:DNA invertase Pin-like site-specific DNA recombinase
MSYGHYFDRTYHVGSGLRDYQIGRKALKTRAILYCRVSTADQADNGISLEAQKAKLEAYATAMELEVAAVITDAGESAKSLNRPGLQEALGMLRTNKADALLICKLDRLSRSVRDWSELVDRYFGERGGKQLLSVADSIDTRTAAGRLVLNVLMSVAAWEREATGERTRDALRHKIAKRERVGKVRYGFDLAADGKCLVANPLEQAAIALMQQLRAQGLTLRAIAAALTERGIETKQGLSTWSNQAVRYILRQDRTAA